MAELPKIDPFSVPEFNAQYPELNKMYQDDFEIATAIETAMCAFNHLKCGCMGKKLVYILSAHFLIMFNPPEDSAENPVYGFPKMVTSESLGDASVGYQEAVSVSGGGDGVGYNQTKYGRMFSQLLKIHCGNFMAIT